MRWPVTQHGFFHFAVKITGHEALKTVEAYTGIQYRRTVEQGITFLESFFFLGGRSDFAAFREDIIDIGPFRRYPSSDFDHSALTTLRSDRAKSLWTFSL